MRSTMVSFGLILGGGLIGSACVVVFGFPAGLPIGMVLSGLFGYSVSQRWL